MSLKKNSFPPRALEHLETFLVRYTSQHDRTRGVLKISSWWKLFKIYQELLEEVKTGNFGEIPAN